MRGQGGISVVLAAWELRGLRRAAAAIARVLPPPRTASQRDGARPAAELHVRRYLLTQLCAVSTPELAHALRLHRTTVWRSCIVGRELVARAVASGAITRESLRRWLQDDEPLPG